MPTQELQEQLQLSMEQNKRLRSLLQNSEEVQRTNGAVTSSRFAFCCWETHSTHTHNTHTQSNLPTPEYVHAMACALTCHCSVL